MVRLRAIFAHIVVALLFTGCALGTSSRTDVSSAAAAAPSAGAGSNEDYRLGPGDIISIRVYDWRGNASPVPTAEDDLRVEKIRLDRSGAVSLPFGDFRAVGKTVGEFEGAITQSLRGRLLRNPRVWISIDEYRPFFVEGQVNRAGAYPYQLGLNVRKAITIAGGLRERASLQKMFLVRENDPSNARIKVDMNTHVGPGDTITVEESLF